jgi:hypothetical protein
VEDQGKPEALLTCWGTLKKNSVVSGVSGRTWEIVFDTSPDHAEAFVALVREEAYGLTIDDYRAATDGVKVKRVVTADSSDGSHTTITLHVTEDQIARSGVVNVLVGPNPLEFVLNAVQLHLDLSARAT